MVSTKFQLVSHTKKPPPQIKTEKSGFSTAAAKKTVKEVLEAKGEVKQRYGKLTPAQHFKIGKKDGGFMRMYPDLMLSEPTARRAKNQYLDKLKKR